MVQAATGDLAASLRQNWDRYRSLNPDASGADYLVQHQGGVLEFDPTNFELSPRDAALQTIHIRVLQASHQQGRKTVTHSHLQNLTSSRLESLLGLLAPSLERGLDFFSRGEAHGFAQSMETYGDVLASQDLEDATTHQDRRALSKVPGVLGVKGTGAHQSDALIAVVDPLRLDLDHWRAVVGRLQLRDLGELSPAEAGLSLEGSA